MKKSICTVLALLFIFSFCACGNTSGDSHTTTQNTTQEVKLPTHEEAVDDGKLQLIGFDSFSGVFIEDGSDREEENVLSLKLKNLTDETLVRATLIFTDENGEEYTFSVNTIPAGKQVTVLEIHAKDFRNDAVYSCTKVETTYSDADRLCKDTVTVATRDNRIFVTNATEKTLGLVYVYYKNLDADGNLFGGITYRTEFKDVEPSATLDENTMHFNASSRVVMVEVK